MKAMMIPIRLEAMRLSDSRCPAPRGVAEGLTIAYMESAPFGVAMLSRRLWRAIHCAMSALLVAHSIGASCCG